MSFPSGLGSYTLYQASISAISLGVMKCYFSSRKRGNITEEERRQADIQWRVGKKVLAMGLGGLVVGFGLNYLSCLASPFGERNIILQNSEYGTKVCEAMKHALWCSVTMDKSCSFG